jgi:hypothetical protein
MANQSFTSRKPAKTRRSITTAVIVASALALGACSSLGSGSSGSGSDTGTSPSAQPLVSDSQSDDSGLSDSGDSGTTVSGYVRLQNGQPIAGEPVEFESPLGYNYHTTTDGNGYYSMTITEGVYYAEAPDVQYNTDVVDRPNNTVSVPPSTTINFVAVPTGIGPG